MGRNLVGCLSYFVLTAGAEVRKRDQNEADAQVRAAWRRAARRVMTPLVGALIEHGIRYPEIVRLVGEAVVHSMLAAARSAEDSLVEAGGVPRALARRLLREHDRNGGPTMAYAAATRLVDRWLTLPEFSENGRPKSLPMRGTVSFARLAAMSGVDPAAALPALKMCGMVRVRHGRLTLLKDAYVPSRGKAEMLDILGRDAAEFLRMMIRNTKVATRNVMFQRKASYDNIGGRALRDLRTVLYDEAKRTLQGVNRVLASVDRDRNPMAPGGHRTRVSFGIYISEEPVDVGGRRGAAPSDEEAW